MSFWSKLGRTFRPGRYDAEIEEEIRYHLAMKEQGGGDRRTARVRFGNPSKLKEDTRAQGLMTTLESWARDTKQALRYLRKSPVLSAVVILSLALGIGANSAIYSLISAALLKPLPVKDPHLLRAVEWTNQGFPQALCNLMWGDTQNGSNGQMRGSSIAPRVYRELAKGQTRFGSLIGFSDGEKVAVAVNKQPAEQAQLEYVSANFFQGLGVPLTFGRAFMASDDQAGKAALVVISDRYWHKWLGAAEMFSVRR